MKLAYKQIDRFLSWVETGGGWTIFAFFVGILFGLSLISSRWDWTLLWTSIAAIANVALAFATFMVIRRDSRLAALEKEPNVTVGSFVGASVGDKPAMTFKIANLGKLPVFIYGVTKQVEGISPNTRKSIGIMMLAYQDKDVTITLPIIKSAQVTLHLLFVVSADSNTANHLTIVGHLSIDDDGIASYILEKYLVTLDVNINDEAFAAVPE